MDEATGMMVHEPDLFPPITITTSGFGEKINRMLIY